MTDNQTYDIADEDDGEKPSSAPGAVKPAAAKPAPSSSNEDENEGDEDHLPPPLSSETNPKPWMVAAICAAAVLLIAWLAGARPLAPVEPSADGVAVIGELTFGARLIGFARTLVFLPLATLSLVFGALCMAFIRQRPIGDGIGLFARCAAIAAIGMMAWLAPVEVRFLKNSINLLGPPLIAGILTIPVFRLDVRDAGLMTGFSVLGIGVLTLFANVIVWAVVAN
jgi:hypothetical protein